MKIRNNLIFSFIFTFSLMTFILWNRLIRIRFSKDIYYHEIWQAYDKIVAVLLLIYLTLFLYYLLKYLKVIPRPKSKIKTFFNRLFKTIEKKPFTLKLLAFNENVFRNGPTNVYNFFYVYIYVKPFIWLCGKKLSYYFQDNPFIPYFIGFILPKLIIVIILFIEITFFNGINYFYKALILYLIPLIFKIILYMIEHHTKDYLDLLHEFFKFELVDEGDSLEITDKVFTDSIKLQEQNNLRFFAEKDWMPLQWMYSVVCKITLEKEKYNYVTSAIVYGMFALSFLVYLLKITGVLPT